MRKMGYQPKVNISRETREKMYQYPFKAQSPEFNYNFFPNRDFHLAYIEFWD